MLMEHCKEVAAHWFFSLSAGNKLANTTAYPMLYDKFVAEATREPSPKDCYAADSSREEYKEEEYFKKMMFLDGYFIFYFIHHVVVDREFQDDM